jgi:hypothetical protein
MEMGMAGNPVGVFRDLLKPSPQRPAGLIQRDREKLQARDDARRTVDLHVSAYTLNQTLSALLFLYRELLKRDLEGVEALVAGVLDGRGLRLMEALRRRGLWKIAPPPRLGAKVSQCTGGVGLAMDVSATTPLA